MPEPDVNALIPELRRWNDGRGIGIDAWLSCVGSFEHAVAYGRLFWPPFTLHGDCILFADFDPVAFDGFVAQCAGDRQAVERVMNHVHLKELFQQPEAPSPELMLHLAGVLQETWLAKLGRDFPGRPCTVEIVDGDRSDMQLTFHQAADVRD